VSRRIVWNGAKASTTLSRMVGLNPRELDSMSISTFEEMTETLVQDLNFPIDLVFTWVDGNDAAWRELRAGYDTTHVHVEASSSARFIDRDEIRYALRSVAFNAPWVNHIYIVTEGHAPAWLDRTSDKVTVVTHREIFSDESVLPTFNSHAIEANIHRIPGLSEHFIYLNDDMFFGRPVRPELFFTSNGISKYFPSPSRVPFWEGRPEDTPVDRAVKNGRELLRERFGAAQSHVMEHAPYALRKSVLEQMERDFAAAFNLTSGNRFRDEADINIPSHLAHHYAHCVGKAIDGQLAFSYIGLSVADVQRRLARLLERRDRDAFCLNDTFTLEDELEDQLPMVRGFLESYFPVPGPWEVDK